MTARRALRGGARGSSVRQLSSWLKISRAAVGTLWRSCIAAGRRPRPTSGTPQAAYKLPRAVQFVSEVPITASGKIMRRLLKDIDDGTR
jgi:acyl-CoA synthetase (AMP-forming)/AMP-acid ligase II